MSRPVPSSADPAQLGLFLWDSRGHRVPAEGLNPSHWHPLGRRASILAALAALIALTACGSGGGAGTADDAEGVGDTSAAADATTDVRADHGGDDDDADDVVDRDARVDEDARSADTDDAELPDTTAGADAVDVSDVVVDAGDGADGADTDAPPPLRVLVLDSGGSPVSDAVVQVDNEAGGSPTVVRTGADGRVEVEPGGTVAVTAVGQNNLGHREIMSVLGVGAGDSVVFRPRQTGPLVPIPLCSDPTNVIVGWPETLVLVPYEVVGSSCGSSVECEVGQYCNVDAGSGLPVPSGAEGRCYSDGAARVQASSSSPGARCSVIRPPANSEVLCVCASSVADRDDRLLIGAWAVDELGRDVGFSTVDVTDWDDTMTSLRLAPWTTLGATPIALDVTDDIDFSAVRVSAGYALSDGSGSVSRTLVPSGTDTLSMRSLFAASEPIAGVMVRFYAANAGNSLEFIRTGLPAEDWTSSIALSDPRMAVFGSGSVQNVADSGLALEIEFEADRNPIDADALTLELRWLEETDLVCAVDEDCTATTTCNAFAGRCEEQVTWRILADPSTVVSGRNTISVPSLGTELSAIYTYSDAATPVTLTGLWMYASDFVVGFSSYVTDMGFESIPPSLPAQRVEVRSAFYPSD